MDIQSKSAPVKALGDNTFHVLLSTPHRDRDGDQLHLDEWQRPLPEQIPFSADHDMSSGGIVGSGTPSLTARGLEVHGEWADTDRARHVRSLVTTGHLRHVSVEFMSHRDAKSGNASRELLGGSFVYTPSNPHARVLSSKALSGLLQAITKAPDAPPPMDLVQAIHDAAGLLGAQCASDADDEPVPDEDDGSADGANKSAGAAVVMDANLAAFRVRLGALLD